MLIFVNKTAGILYLLPLLRRRRPSSLPTPDDSIIFRHMEELTYWHCSGSYHYEYFTPSVMFARVVGVLITCCILVKKRIPNKFMYNFSSATRKMSKKCPDLTTRIIYQGVCLLLCFRFITDRLQRGTKSIPVFIPGPCPSFALAGALKLDNLEELLWNIWPWILSLCIAYVYQGFPGSCWSTSWARPGWGLTDWLTDSLMGCMIGRQVQYDSYCWFTGHMYSASIFSHVYKTSDAMMSDV